jgi:nucleotide-binding universal stress UspA family protein
MGEFAQRRPVLVSINASPASRRAVLWAATEARLRRTSLIVTNLPVVGGPAARPDDTSDIHALLQAGVAAACLREPGIAVGTRLLHRDGSEQLITLSQSAAMIVLGIDNAASEGAADLQSPVDDRVALQARCPIVTIPATHSNQSSRPRVVVGWDDLAGHGALRAAAEEATLRDAALVVVILADGADDEAAASHHSDRQLPLSEVSKLVGKDLSSSHAQVEHQYGPQPSSLIAFARDAELLVISSPPATQWSLHWQSVTADTVRRALCPVMLVDPHKRTRAREEP